MENAFLMYKIITALWCLFAIYVIIYVYITCVKQHKPSKIVKYEKNPPKLNFSELSYLMYKKIEPEVLVVIILDLVEKGFLKTEKKDGEYYLSENLGSDSSKLTDAEKFVINMINRIIDGKKNIKVSDLYDYCNNGRNAASFLLNYEIFLKMIRNESKNHPYFESKMNYIKINSFNTIGNLLFIIGVMFAFYKYFSILGLSTIVISYTINEMFLNSYKRNKEANELYYSYLSYKRYLQNIDTLKFDKDTINTYLFNGIILRVKEIDQKLKPNSYVGELNKAVYRCIKKSLNKK